MQGVFDISNLLVKYNQFSTITGQQLKEVMTQEATLSVSNAGKIPGVIQITPPFNARDNRPQSAFLAAKASIERDLAAVFQPVKLKGTRTITKVFGKTLRHPVTISRTRERWPDVASIAKERWKRKNETGRKVMGRGQKAAFYVDASKLEVVRRESIALIGLACACWYVAALQAGLKPRGVPAWVSRHRNAFAAGDIKITETSVVITLTSSLPYNTALGMEERLQRVLGYREKALERRLPYVLAAAAKQAGLKAA